MKGHEIAAAMERRNEDDIRFASLTWAQRKHSMECDRRLRLAYRVIFLVVGLSCDMGAYMEILVLLVFGVLGPIAIRYDLL